MAQLSTGDGLPDVVVTGIAMTTALATDADSTWKKLLDKQSGIRKLDDPFVEEFDLPVRIGGHLLEDFDPELTRVELRRFLFLQKIATVVGRRVWANAGSPEVDSNRLMVSIGTGMGSTEEMVVAYDDIRARGIRADSPVGRAEGHAQRGGSGGGAGTCCKSRDYHAGVRLRLRGRGYRSGVAQHRVW